MFDDLLRLLQEYVNKAQPDERAKSTLWSLSKLIATQSKMLMQGELPDDVRTQGRLVEAQALAFALAEVLMDLNDDCERNDLLSEIESYLNQSDDAETRDQF